MKNISLKSVMILLSLVPVISAVIIIALASSRVLVSSLKQNTREELIVAARALKEYYEYDIINNNDLVDGFIKYDTSYIDSMRTTGVDLTLFKENIRFMTTITNSAGKRIEGTPASEAVWREVSRGKDYYSDSVQINGIDYHVYYMPIQAEQINGIVQEITALSKECVEQAAEVRELIVEEGELLSTTHDKFMVLAEEIRQSIREIASVSDITAKLEGIKDKILEEIGDLAAISEETSATNEEVAASIESIAGNVKKVSDDTHTMNDLAEELNEAVSYFH